MDWVLKNIFNCSDADIAALKSSVLNENQNVYYLDGYYYNMIGGTGGGYTASITGFAPSGGKYLVTYSLKSMYETESRSCYAIVDQKRIDGKGYWFLYYNTDLKSGQDPTKTGGFFDVKPGDYYCDPVLWAVERGITTGTSLTTFSPSAACTKGQILTFLWRADEQPDPSIANPFRDINSSDYYYKAALWAAEHGLVSGTTFNAEQPCTRAMTVTYLWKLSGSPSASKNSFSDVPANADYANAVAWAVNQRITTGTGTNRFSPNAVCTRGEIVTFLYRYIVEILPPSSSANPSGESGETWNEVYRDFVMNKTFLTKSYPYECDREPWGDDEDHMVGLYDMDADGIPELFISNGFFGRVIMRNYVYTYVNGKIEYIGNAPIGFCFFSPESQFNGMWSSSNFEGVFYTYYYYKDGNTIKDELVLTDNGLGGDMVQKTTNTALFNASDISKMPYMQTSSVNAILEKGWDAFVVASTANVVMT